MAIKSIMKKYLTKIAVTFALLLSVFTMSGCSKANIYRAFNNNGSNLSKAHILEKISIKKLISMIDDIEDGEYIYVFYGTPTDSTSCTNVTVYNEQAIQFGVETLYYVDSDVSDKDRTKLENTVGIFDATQYGALWSFNSNGKYFDSSEPKWKTNDSDVDYSNIELAQLCFRNAPDPATEE